MAEDHDRRRRRLVVVGRQDAAAKGADAERREVVAGDVFGAQRPCRRLAPFRRTLSRAPPAWNAVTSSNSGSSAFSRSNSGNENMPQRSCGPPCTQQLSRRRCGRAARDR